MNPSKDPMAVELERIEAELEAQNLMLEQLHESANHLGNVTFDVPRAELRRIAGACATRSSTTDPRSAIRC